MDTFVDVSVDAGVWTLEPHVCQKCFGRIASRPDGSGADRLMVYQCTNCGATTAALHVASACCCGLRVARKVSGGLMTGLLDSILLQCVENPSPTSDFPSRYVAVEAVK